MRGDEIAKKKKQHKSRGLQLNSEWLREVHSEETRRDETIIQVRTELGIDPDKFDSAPKSIQREYYRRLAENGIHIDF
jgi:hypothetical protein